MARIACVADVHIGNPVKHKGPRTAGINARGQLVLDSFSWAVKEARRRECDAMISLGDLFDGVRPNPQLIAATQEILDGIQFVALLGNHEMVSTTLGDHSLGPLDPVGDVIDETQPYQVEDVTLGMVPFRPGPADEWLPVELERLGPPGPKSILCLHLGIADSSTPTWLQGAHDSVNVEWLSELLAERGWSCAVAGNWHERRAWSFKDVPILQVGTLCPTGWNNPGFADYGWMGFWEDGEFESIRVPGPRFVKVRSEMELDAAVELAEEDECELFVEWLAKPEELAAANAAVRAAIDEGKVYAGGALPDDPKADERAREAALAASSEDELAKALVAYVRSMDLPEGITVERVLELAGSYLSK